MGLDLSQTVTPPRAPGGANKDSVTGLSGLKNLLRYNFWRYSVTFYTILCPVDVFFFNAFLAPVLYFTLFYAFFVAKSDIRTLFGVKLSKKLSKVDKSAFF